MKKMHIGSPNRGVDISAEVLTVQKPPEFLWYAADEKEAARVRKKGLTPGLFRKSLFETPALARAVGKPYLFRIRAGELYWNGGNFYRSADGIWQTNCVKPEWITEIGMMKGEYDVTESDKAQ